MKDDSNDRPVENRLQEISSGYKANTDLTTNVQAYKLASRIIHLWVDMVPASLSSKFEIERRIASTALRLVIPDGTGFVFSDMNAEKVGVVLVGLDDITLPPDFRIDLQL